MLFPEIECLVARWRFHDFRKVFFYNFKNTPGILTVKIFGQLPKGVTRPCSVELGERDRLVYILG